MKREDQICLWIFFAFFFVTVGFLCTKISDVTETSEKVAEMVAPAHLSNLESAQYSVALQEATKGELGPMNQWLKNIEIGNKNGGRLPAIPDGATRPGRVLRARGIDVLIPAK